MAETVGVFGAGALGTLLATRLSRAGHAVHILARSGARQEALRREAPPPHLEERAQGLSAATLIFLCVKSHDTAEAAAQLSETETSAGICSLQNGWGNMETLEAGLPSAPLIAGATSLGAYLDENGALHASSAGTTWLAPWGKTEYRWAEYAATLFESAGLKAEASRNAAPILWQKLALNAAVNPLSAISGRPNGAILESPSLLRIAEAAAREAVRVGVRLGHLEPGFDAIPPLRALLEDTKGNRSSMAEDLARGRITEVDAIVGSIVRAARNLREPAPILEGLDALIRAAEGSPTLPSGAAGGSRASFGSPRAPGN